MHPLSPRPKRLPEFEAAPPRRRRGMPFLMTACLILGTITLAERLAAKWTLNNLYARGLVLERDGQRVPVWLPRSPDAPRPGGHAIPAGAASVTFGQAYLFATPDGARVSCEHKLIWLWCDGGWQAERADII